MTGKDGHVRARSRAVLAVAPPVAAAAIGGLAARDARAVYARLHKPGWAPPGRVFGPVWSVLYTLIGLVGWRVGSRRTAVLHLLQLALNASWTPLFFGARRRRAALSVSDALDAAVAAEIAALLCDGDRRSAALLTPYLAWCVFATALTAAVSDPAARPAGRR